MLQKLRQLEEEEPQLHIVWNAQLGEIHAQVMGEVQIEILQSLIKERYGVDVTFGTGNIVYKETILAPVSGAGHFEPLRHYAEVHLLMEPGERGSGIQVDSVCSVDALDLNWQRLILTHLLEKEHVGVLTGAPVTDLRITLTAGRAHQKHTEGGDFRQATYRAVRQGLKKAKSVLLEPFYAFRLEVPSEVTGRAMADIQRMCGSFDAPQTEGDLTVLTGSAPVSEMRGYPREVSAYTRGRGRLSCTLKGYEPCHNAEEIIAAADYDSERDLDNPTGSVFCSHGAGFLVSWDVADSYMHVSDGISQEPDWDEEEEEPSAVMGMPSGMPDYKDRFHDEDELKAIFARTYGTGGQEPRNNWKRTTGKRAEASVPRTATASRQEPIEEYLLVDGYNIIFAWPKLHELAETDIGAARGKLMDILCNYQGFVKCRLILVFDAYRVEGHPGEVLKYHNIHVVYTKEAETADQYIEKTVREIGRKYHVTVATSDGLEQVIILGEGAKRLSASDLAEEVAWAEKQIREMSEEKRIAGRSYLFDGLDEEMAKHMEDVRLGKKDFGL
jgi:predicted RNA-binding protein with PIN domain